MRLLLDTHTLLWWLADDSTLTLEARIAIDDEANVVAVSAATAWEISIKRTLGKLVAPYDLGAQLTANDFEPIAITVADALVAGSLPRHHDDPFDRMLVAQAQARGLKLVTRDTRLALYGIELLPA